MSDIANKVETLMEAMPYLQKYQGKIIVIKYGGNAMINESLKNAVMNDLAVSYTHLTLPTKLEV